MGVTCECLVEGAASAAGFAAVETEIERLERIFSRFRPFSELSRLNAAGRAVVGGELLEVIALALEARNRTEGRFDPTVHDALVAAGYDRTFAQIAPTGPALTPVACGGRVEIDVPSRTVVLGRGVRLDLGGIAKGWAAERACDLLAAAGPCLVNLGGDIAVRGVPAEGVWPVGVETPSGRLTLGLAGGGLATSGRDRRRWQRGGEEQHHLIDPATGLPAAGDVLRITAVAGDAVTAEIEAKSLFLLGADEAVASADLRGIPCLVVTLDGLVLRAGGLA
jgi:thiamine biosynthesis lipoprotein